MRKFNLKKLLSEAKNRKQRRAIIFFLVKLGVSKKNPSEKVTLARHIIQNMAVSPHFPTPTPTLADLGVAADALDTAEAALDGSQAKALARNNAEKALVSKLNQIQAYVETIANGDPAIVLSAGMEVRDPKTPTGLLGPVTEITVKLGLMPGTVDINWKGIKGSKLYIIEASNNQMSFNDWKVVGESTKSKITIENLQSGAVYAFRITCVSSAGSGPKSEVFAIKVY